MHSRSFQRTLCFFFLIVILNFSSSQHPPSLRSFSEIKYSPNSSQNLAGNSSPSLTCLVDSNLEVFAGDQIWINWSVKYGIGNSFFIEQISDKGQLIIGFGVINKDLEILSYLVNTTVPGSYTIRIHIYNSTASSQDSTNLIVTEQESLSLPIALIWIVGSVAVITDATALIYWRAKSKGKRNLDNSFNHSATVPEESQFQDEEDQIFLSSTHISHILFLRGLQPKIEHVVTFKEIKDAKNIEEIVLKQISSNLGKMSFFNSRVDFQKSILFVTLISFPFANLFLCIISDVGLHPSFINSIGLTTKKLLRDNKIPLQNLKILSEFLNAILHLDRSRTFDVSADTKLMVLKNSPAWQSSRESSSFLSSDQIKQLDIDIAALNVGQLLDMGVFLEKVRREMDLYNKETRRIDQLDE